MFLTVHCVRSHGEIRPGGYTSMIPGYNRKGSVLIHRAWRTPLFELLAG